MALKDLKYLTAYSIPSIALLGIHLASVYSFITPLYVFVIIPLLELILPSDTSNLTPEVRKAKKSNKLFDWLLYLNIPLVFGTLYYALLKLSFGNLSFFESTGIILSTGLVLGANGINVAHELGHRTTRIEKTLAKLLLLPSLYMHFYIEHNFGHHLNAATKEDPATAKLNQSVYSFWFSSVTRQYIKAWKIQRDLNERNNKGFFSFYNDMFWYTALQFIYLFVIYTIFGITGIIAGISCAVVGFILLETINYIEHYGLLRHKLPSGRYERVKQIHSWNSNHTMGRIVLYELTRHSDHHYKSSKKYQLLDYHDVSPQMPYGYPTSMVLSLIPPLWFSIMNKRIPKDMKEG
jgi:alkane 1-monooxygenase